MRWPCALFGRIMSGMAPILHCSTPKSKAFASTCVWQGDGCGSVWQLAVFSLSKRAGKGNWEPFLSIPSIGGANSKITEKKGYGRQAMLAMEALNPKVKVWKLDTPGESDHLHRFYESLGYVKTGVWKDSKRGMTPRRREWDCATNCGVVYCLCGRHFLRNAHWAQTLRICAPQGTHAVFLHGLP